MTISLSGLSTDYFGGVFKDVFTSYFLLLSLFLEVTFKIGFSVRSFLGAKQHFFFLEHMTILMIIPIIASNKTTPTTISTIATVDIFASVYSAMDLMESTKYSVALSSSSSHSLSIIEL